MRSQISQGEPREGRPLVLQPSFFFFSTDCRAGLGIRIVHNVSYTNYPSMTEPFQQSEFGSEDGELSPSEHFESVHSPTLGYTYIEKSLASLDAGLDKFDDETATEAEIYANVTLFREVMQYIEEYGIYLYSRLDSDVDFVEAMTGTMPKQVKTMFEAIRDGDFDELVEEYHAELTGDEWLKNQFGYDKLEAHPEGFTLTEIADDDDLTVESVDEAITVSLETIRSHLQEIASFFLRFEDPYNAVKHGNRVMPLLNHGFSIEGPNEDIEIDLEEDVVSFLCKTSGDRRGGHHYTFTVPVRVLRDQAVAVAKLARNQYTHIYDMKQKVTESVRTGEEVTLHPNLYGVTESTGEGEEFTLKSIENADTTIWIPADAISNAIDQYELPYRNQIAVGLHRRGNDMIVQTAGNGTPSYEYPLLIDVEMESDKNYLQGMQLTQNFSFTLLQLPLWQYLEIRSLSEIEPIQDVTLEFEPDDVSDTRHTNQPVSLPSLPEPDFPEELEYMRYVGRAADTEIWLPYYWPSRVLQVIDFYRERFDLTQEVAENLLADIEELTSDEVATIPSIAILDPDSEDDDGNYRTIQHQELRLMAYGIVLDVGEDGETAEFAQVPGSDPRYDRQEVDFLEGVGITLIEETPEQALELFMESGLDAVTQLSITSEEAKANAVLETKRKYGPKFTWYYLDKFYFALYEDVPPHLEESVKQISE